MAGRSHDGMSAFPSQDKRLGLALILGRMTQIGSLLPGYPLGACWYGGILKAANAIHGVADDQAC